MKKQIFATIFVMLIILCLWQCNTQKTVPHKLAGIWKTKNPHYEGSFLEFHEDAISFGTVEGDVQTYTIIKIKSSKEEGDWESFIVHYLDDNSKRCELPIYFHPVNDGILRLKNKQEITWFREKT
jgi:hypothetical protein